MTQPYRKPSDIPTDWELNDPDTWYLSTTVDAFGGIHAATGMTMRGYRDISSSPGDLGETVEEPDDGDWEDTRAWWWDVIEADFDYRCVRAEIDYDQETAILEALGFDTIDQWEDANLGTGDYELDAIYQRRFLGVWDIVRGWDAERLRQLRERLDWTQAQMADEINQRSGMRANRHALSRWESGRVAIGYPAQRALSQIAQAHP